MAESISGDSGLLDVPELHAHRPERQAGLAGQPARQGRAAHLPRPGVHHRLPDHRAPSSGGRRAARVARRQEAEMVAVVANPTYTSIAVHPGVRRRDRAQHGAELALPHRHARPAPGRLASVRDRGREPAGRRDDRAQRHRVRDQPQGRDPAGAQRRSRPGDRRHPVLVLVGAGRRGAAVRWGRTSDDHHPPGGVRRGRGPRQRARRRSGGDRVERRAGRVRLSLVAARFTARPGRQPAPRPSSLATSLSTAQGQLGDRADVVQPDVLGGVRPACHVRDLAAGHAAGRGRQRRAGRGGRRREQVPRWPCGPVRISQVHAGRVDGRRRRQLVDRRADQ